MLSVIILSYNTKEITLECLGRLYKSEEVKFETIVIDNNSSDGSAEAIAKNFSQVRLFINKENRGFAVANNQGMTMAKGDKILLLNSDAYVFSDTLAKCYAHSADVLGCKLLNRDLSIQASWGYFPSLRRVFLLMTFIDNFPIIRKFIDSIHVRDMSRYDREQKVDWVTGAFVMLKKEVFEKVGGIDEKYFMYGEEMEWMYRIKKAGFEVVYSPIAKAMHLKGVSTKSNAQMLASEMKGYVYWFSKHNSQPEKMVLKCFLILGCLVRIPFKKDYGLVLGELLK